MLEKPLKNGQNNFYLQSDVFHYQFYKNNDKFTSFFGKSLKNGCNNLYFYPYTFNMS